MTDVLYLPAIDRAYDREFDARVVKASRDGVVLDRTLFYATGGGQPHDTGALAWEGGTAQVVDVSKKGEWTHKVSGDVPPAGGTVHGTIDWARRHALMRMHTAQHVLSAVIYKDMGASTVGNNISKDYSRVDFAIDRFAEGQLRDIEAACNDVFEKDVAVQGYEEDRASLEARIDARSTLMHLIPASVQTLRVVEIPGVDICPCAGTHVRTTGEIGRMRILKTENKGAGRTRFIYELV